MPLPRRPAPRLPLTTRLPARVLVVDPDVQVQASVADSLALHRHSVQGTADADAIETAAEQGFDLVLMNPEARALSGTRHGHDAWQRLQGLRERHPTLPVVVLQADSTAADRTVALELGADAVMDLPLDARELRARVASLLGAAAVVPIIAPRASAAASGPGAAQALLDQALSTASALLATGLRPDELLQASADTLLPPGARRAANARRPSPRGPAA